MIVLTTLPHFIVNFFVLFSKPVTNGEFFDKWNNYFFVGKAVESNNKVAPGKKIITKSANKGIHLNFTFSEETVMIQKPFVN